jgi:CheY-like chemotaxis protein
MNGIMGMLQLVLGTRLDPQQQARLETAYRSAESLLSLLNDILEFSKLEAGKFELECRPFNVADLVRDVAQLFEQSCAARGLVLRIEVPRGLEHPLVGDPHRLRQILNNLVGNAVKFTAAGTVLIRVDAGPATDGSQPLTLAVTDTGIGIPADRLGLLFQPFSQVDSSTARRFGGTGLGLAICRQLAELMGGRIEAHSVENAGSTFALHLTLPVATNAASPSPSADPTDRAAQAAQPAGAGRARHAGSARVLLVEDNAVNRELAVAMLEAAEIDVTAAEDGDAALELGAKQTFDIVLMDCQMPGRDGYATTREWRRRERVLGDTRTAIIALTANAMQGDREQCLAAGMDDYLAKPFTRAALDTMLQQWLAAGTGASALRTG